MGRAWPRLVIFAVPTLLFVIASYTSQNIISYGLFSSSNFSFSNRFAFSEALISPLAHASNSSNGVRNVHPRLAHIDKWISSVGAGIAIADLDGNGFPNDACLTDPRSNSVSVEPLGDSPADYKRFTLLLPAKVAPMGCLPGDFNEDGRMDLLVYFWGRSPLVYIASDFKFDADNFKPLEVVANAEEWFTSAAVIADVDGDSHMDLVIGNYFPDRSGVLDREGKRAVEMQHSMSRAYNGGRNRILIWQPAESGSIRFSEAKNLFEKEVSNGWTLAVAAADLDGDLRPEIYFANDFGPDRLLHNITTKAGEPKFELVEGRRQLLDPRSRVLGQDSFKGMGVDFGDLRGNGRLAIYVSNISQNFALHESHFLFEQDGVGPFEGRYTNFVDRSASLGLSQSDFCWDAKLADFDNDGVLEALQACGFFKGTTNRWPELHELAMGNDELVRFPEVWPMFSGDADLSGDARDHFFAMTSEGNFNDISAEVGLRRGTVSRGIAIADVHRTGRLDFAIARQWEDSSFFKNESRSAGKSLVLDLRLRGTAPGSTRPAIGASATAILPSGRKPTSYVDGGNGHSGKRAPEIHIGLGHLEAEGSVEVEINWRDGSSSSVNTRVMRLVPGFHRILLDPSAETPTLLSGGSRD